MLPNPSQRDRCRWLTPSPAFFVGQIASPLRSRPPAGFHSAPIVSKHRWLFLSSSSRKASAASMIIVTSLWQGGLHVLQSKGHRYSSPPSIFGSFSSGVAVEEEVGTGIGEWEGPRTPWTSSTSFTLRRGGTSLGLLMALLVCATLSLNLLWAGLPRWIMWAGVYTKALLCGVRSRSLLGNGSATRILLRSRSAPAEGQHRVHLFQRTREKIRVEQLQLGGRRKATRDQSGVTESLSDPLRTFPRLISFRLRTATHG